MVGNDIECARQAAREEFVRSVGFRGDWDSLDPWARVLVDKALDERAERAAAEQGAAVQLDAARWNAFTRCKRIRMFGWAGAGLSEDDRRQPGDNYVHFGGEFWTVHPAFTPPETVERNVQVLTAFADAALAEQKSPMKLPEGA